MANFGGKSLRVRGRSQWQIHALLVILFLALCFISTSHAQGTDDLEPAAAPGDFPRQPRFSNAGTEFSGTGQTGAPAGYGHNGPSVAGFGGRAQESYVPTNLTELGHFLSNFDLAWYNQNGPVALDRIWRLSQEFVASSGTQTKVIAGKLKSEIVAISKRETGKITVTDLPLALCMDPSRLTADHRVALRSAFEGTGVTVPEIAYRPQPKADESAGEANGSISKELAPIASEDGRALMTTSRGSPARGPAGEQLSGNGSPIRRPGRPKLGDQFEPSHWDAGCLPAPTLGGVQPPPGGGLAGNNGGQNSANGNDGSGGDGAGVPGGGPKPPPFAGLPGISGGGQGGAPPGVSPPPPGGPQPPFGTAVFAPPPAESRVPPSNVKFENDRSGIEATLAGIEQDSLYYRLLNLQQTAQNGQALYTLMSRAFPNPIGSPVNAAVLSAGMASINAMAESIKNSLKKGKDSSSSDE